MSWHILVTTYNAYFFIEYLQILEYIVSSFQIVTTKRTTILICVFFDLVEIIFNYNLQAFMSVFVEEDIIWRRLNFFNQGFTFVERVGSFHFISCWLATSNRTVFSIQVHTPNQYTMYVGIQGSFSPVSNLFLMLICEY